LLKVDKQGFGKQYLEHGFVVPGVLWDQLYAYQRLGVEWLWSLHQQRLGFNVLYYDSYQVSDQSGWHSWR
jgi:hypothetical protein